MKLYWKKTCTSCRDARAALKAKSIAFDELEYSKNPLPAATVEDIVAKVGSVAAVLNTRHETAKAKDWATTPPSAAVFAKAVEKEVNLIRRPILVDGAKVIVGFDKPAYAKLK